MRLPALPFLLSAVATASPVHTESIAENLRDPMGMAIAPDGDIYIAEREGRILRIRPSTGGVFPIGEIPVQALRSDNPDSDYAREDGLQDIALDPDFSENRRVYLYYSHPSESANRLSRFVLRDGVIDLSSESSILTIPMERDNRVCHHGGDLEFGPDGLLYLSTGDNTNPFESDGYAPIDDRENRAFADAMRSSGNTDDLRGKILRIRLTESGYEVPTGNLFPIGAENARPEIYVMGCRNPFRISIDPKNNFLYWGDVGPDAGENSARGPRGHDEINQAREAGNFGWPFFVADNQPYAHHDFSRGENGALFDPSAPENPGHRNTGRKTLPPARSALVWYPYAESPEFPVPGSGGRNAMAGPVFYHDDSRRWNLLGPEDDHTLIAYDWSRGRMWKVRLDAKDHLRSIDPFLDGLTHPMDLQMQDDGTFWLLEYGREWWFNQTGRLLRLLPASENRPPSIALERQQDRSDTFALTQAEDPDGDPVSIRWWLTQGASEREIEGDLEVTLPVGHGGSELRAVATDGKGGQAIARLSLLDQAPLPELALEILGNPPALGAGDEIRYRIGGSVPPDAEKTMVRARYIPPTGHDAGGVRFPSSIQEIITAKACFACHQTQESSVGPSYLDVALRYRDREDATAYLDRKLIEGGGGIWGETPMPPQIALSEAERSEVVAAILHLADGIEESRGSLESVLRLPPLPPGESPGGAWEISAHSTGFAPHLLRVPAKE